MNRRASSSLGIGTAAGADGPIVGERDTTDGLGVTRFVEYDPAAPVDPRFKPVPSLPALHAILGQAAHYPIRSSSDPLPRSQGQA